MRCYNVTSLKYLVAVALAENQEPRDPESGVALSSAQLRRLAKIEWPSSAPKLVDTVWSEFRLLLESEERSAERVRRRSELARLLVWLNAGSPNFPIGMAAHFPQRPTDLAYTDDDFWYLLAFQGTPIDLATSAPPPVSRTTRRQNVYR